MRIPDEEPHRNPKCAYLCATSSSNYNTRPRPPEVLVHGAEAELIRARETVEDLMAGEKK